MSEASAGRRPIPWGRFAGEFVVIVVGVLVALAVDRWMEGLDNRALVDETLRALAAEIGFNSEQLQRRFDYHSRIHPDLRELQRAVEAGDQVSASVSETLPSGLFLDPLRSTAWEMAAVTEAVRYFDLPLLSFLSITYGLQETLHDRGRAIVDGRTRPELFGRTDQTGTIIFLSVTIEDIRDREEELLKFYAEALRLIRVELGDPEAGSVVEIR